MSDWAVAVVGIAGIAGTVAIALLNRRWSSQDRAADRQFAADAARQSTEYERKMKMRLSIEHLVRMTIAELDGAVDNKEAFDLKVIAAAIRAAKTTAFRSGSTRLSELVDAETDLMNRATMARPPARERASEEEMKSLMSEIAKNHASLTMCMEELGWPW